MMLPQFWMRLLPPRCLNEAKDVAVSLTMNVNFQELYNASDILNAYDH